MTLEWRQYFSNIIASFLQYNKEGKFLGRLWAEHLFPSSTRSHLRDLSEQGKSLSVTQIADFIDYILYPTPRPSQKESSEERIKRHQHNHMKSLAINQLYAMMHVEQKYNYNAFCNISQWLSDSMREVDKNIREKIKIKSDDIYTPFRTKGLYGLASKALRGEDSADLLGWRTWIEDKVLQADNNVEVVQTIMDEAIINLKDFYAKKWYKVKITGLEIANKFKDDNDSKIKDGNDSKIKFPSDVEKTLTDGLKEKHPVTDTQEEKSISFKDVFNIDIENSSLLFEHEKKIIAEAIKKDWTKTGWNGNYADCKFRLLFELEPINGGETLKNLSYEHQIVNMDSENEGWLSDHNIFLDPLKSIQTTLRNSTTVDSGKFVHAVSWGIDKTIAELQQYKRYLYGDDPLPDGMPRKLVEKQVAIRNTIPPAICKLAGIQEGSLYTALDCGDAKTKEKVELAVAKYLLHDQFEKWRLHWFVYDNDHISGLTRSLKNHPSANAKKLSYTQHSSFGKMVDAALTPEGQASGKYCFCGGWSYNLTRSALTGFISDKWTIGIKNKNNNDIHWINISAFWSVVSQGLSMKQWEQAQSCIACAQKDILSIFNEIST